MPRSKKKKIVVRDKMQNYTYYLTEPVGRNFDPDFKPELTPKEMLSIGVFGGKYFADKPKELPASWYKGAKLCKKEHDADLNYFKINASQTLEQWQEKGWIHKDDPRGWFQWYCRYYLGRRHEDDDRQIKRWRAYKRHLSQVKKNCRKGDKTCRPKQKQSLLHWAYDSRKI